MTLLLAALALGNEPLPDHQGDFVLPERTDAPTDAVLLFDTNTDYVTAEVVEGPGAPFTLASELVLDQGWGNESLVRYTHAWEAGATYRVLVEPQAGEVYATGEIVFTVGTGAAEAPSMPVFVTAKAGPWSAEEGLYVGGCCAYTRLLTFEVEASSDDPWAYVELVGLFEGETAITTESGLARLDVGIGPGPHTLVHRQWADDGVLVPENFEIAQVSAGGVRGAPIPVAFAEDLGGRDSILDEATVCGTPAEAGLAPLALALLLASRRRPRGSSRAE